MDSRIDIDQPRWDQDTFTGRLYHFFNVTDPRTVVVPSSKLQEAAKLLQLYRQGIEPKDTKMEEIHYAQKLYQSAFHPDTGELQNVVGRMSFQVPGGMALIGAMMTWYRSNAAVVFWQWANQSFNALVNYTNRNAKSDISTKQLLIAYVSATSSALVAAIGLKSFLTTRAGSLAQRFVPFVAVAAANCVNIPLMRQSEIQDGIILTDKDNQNEVCKSKVAAYKAIGLVIVSRLAIVAPPMLILPFFMERIEQYRWFARRRGLWNPVVQTTLSGVFLALMVPVGCALFAQRNSVEIETLRKWDQDAFRELQKSGFEAKDLSTRLYFNKGL